MLSGMSFHTLTRRLTYANVASTICLFIVLGGTAYAAASITGKQVRNGSLTSADIKDHSLRARDFKAGTLRRGAQAEPGPVGSKGDAGPAGVKRNAGPAGTQRAADPVRLPLIQSRTPVGRLTLPGITGGGPGGTIGVRYLAWSNVLSGDPFSGVGGGSTAQPVWRDVMIAKAPDRSSPQLWKLTATGQHLPSAKLELLTPGASAPYATYTLKDVTTTTFSTRGSGDERQDEVGLSFNAASPPTFAFDAAAPLPELAQPRVGQMTVDGIAGDIDIVQDAWNVANTGTPQFGPFVVSKGVDGASSALLGRFASGMHTKKVTIKLLEPGSDSVYTTYVLTNAVVSSYATVGDGRPLERIGFDAAKYESTTPVAGSAPIHSCFDRLLNASC
jgi:type VI protein secretion system component Hcp